MSATKIVDYCPSKDEPYMNERMLEYFKKKLLDWKEEILEESKGTLDQLQEESLHLPDSADRASCETDKFLE